MTTLNNEITQITRKLNYLLSKSEPEQTKQFTEQERKELLNTIKIVNELEETGISAKQLIQQLEYLRDINAFTSVKKELIDKYNGNGVGTHYNIYVFGHNGRSTFDSCRSKPEIYGSFENGNEEKIFEEGYIILECKPNQMQASNSNQLLNAKNDNNNWIITIEDNDIKVTILQDKVEKGLITIEYDSILVGETVRYAIEHDYYYIQYTTQSNQIELKGIYIQVNVDEKVVNVLESTSTAISTADWERLISDLPFNVVNYSIGFRSRSGNEHEQIRSMIALQRLEKLEQSLGQVFQQSIGTDATANLYGQSTAIAISTLQSQFQDTVRKLTAEYSYSGSKNQSINPSAKQVYGFKKQIPDKFLNKIDIWGNSWIPKYAHTYSVVPRLWFYPFKPRIDDMPTVENYQELSGYIQTNFNQAQWREQTEKIQISQTLPGGSVLQCDAWFETDEVSTEINSVKPGNWVIHNNKAYTAQIDGIPRYQAPNILFNGLRISVDGQKQFNPGLDDCTFITGFEAIYDTTQSISFIIAPTNLASDANPDTIKGTMTYDRSLTDGTTETTTTDVNFIKQQIEYGSGNRTVYKTTLYQITTQLRYNLGWGGTVRFPKPRFSSQEYYNGRDSQGFPADLKNIPLFNYENRIQWDADQSVRLKYTDTSGVNTFDTTDTYNSILQNAAYSYFGKSLTTMTPPFYRTVMQESDISWNTAAKGTIPNYETYVRFGTTNVTNNSNYTVWTDTNLVYTLGNINGSEYNGYATEDGYTPTYFHGLNGIGKISAFINYDSVTRGQITWKDNTGYTLRQIDHVIINNTLKEFSMTVSDLILPGNLTNQLVIAESVVNLQTAVQLLQYYATYLDVLIDNLDRRVTYVEDTLEKIVNTLNTMMSSGGPLGKAGSIVSFLGSGIGMFFPLVGLGISLVGGILSSVQTIENGDVIAGSFDLVIGGAMSALGFYKWSKRIKMKYGQNKLVIGQKIDNVPSQPGYNIIDQGSDIIKTTNRYTNGLFGNTNMDYESIQNAANEQILKNMTLTTRMTKQTPIWAIVDWDDSHARKGYQTVFMVNNSSYARSSDAITKRIVEIDIDSDSDLPIERELDNSTVQQVLDVNARNTDIVQLDFLYYNSYKPKCYKNGLDDQIYNIIAATNSYEVLPSNIKRVKRQTRTARSIKSTWSINTHKNSRKLRTIESETLPIYPIVPLSVYNLALSNSTRDESQQLLLIANVLDVYH